MTFGGEPWDRRTHLGCGISPCNEVHSLLVAAGMGEDDPRIGIVCQSGKHLDRIMLGKAATREISPRLYLCAGGEYRFLICDLRGTHPANACGDRRQY